MISGESVQQVQHPNSTKKQQETSQKIALVRDETAAGKSMV
jgi:hypothetical protein